MSGEQLTSRATKKTNEETNRDASRKSSLLKMLIDHNNPNLVINGSCLPRGMADHSIMFSPKDARYS